MAATDKTEGAEHESICVECAMSLLAGKELYA